MISGGMEHLEWPGISKFYLRSTIEGVLLVLRNSFSANWPFVLLMPGEEPGLRSGKEPAL
jgi:hypothetical protein